MIVNPVVAQRYGVRVADKATGLDEFDAVSSECLQAGMTADGEQERLSSALSELRSKVQSLWGWREDLELLGTAPAANKRSDFLGSAKRLFEKAATEVRQALILHPELSRLGLILNAPSPADQPKDGEQKPLSLPPGTKHTITITPPRFIPPVVGDDPKSLRRAATFHLQRAAAAGDVSGQHDYIQATVYDEAADTLEKEGNNAGGQFRFPYLEQLKKGEKQKEKQKNQRTWLKNGPPPEGWHMKPLLGLLKQIADWLGTSKVTLRDNNGKTHWITKNVGKDPETGWSARYAIYFQTSEKFAAVNSKRLVEANEFIANKKAGSVSIQKKVERGTKGKKKKPVPKSSATKSR